MDQAATTSATTSLLQLLSLSLSPASKVIVKSKTKRVRLEGAFQCRTCGRRFATFQALGGHRTSHKRPRVRADGLDLLLGARPGKGSAVVSNVHRCQTCDAVFPTGQALGGHMRRHRAAAFDAPPALETMPEMTSSSGMSEEGDHHDTEDHFAPRTLIHFL